MLSYKMSTKENTLQLPPQFRPNKHFLFSKTSWRRLEDVFRVTLFVFQDVFSVNTFRPPRRLQDVFARRLAIMSSRRPQDVFRTSSPRRMFAGIVPLILRVSLLNFFIFEDLNIINILQLPGQEGLHFLACH